MTATPQMLRWNAMGTKVRFTILHELHLHALIHTVWQHPLMILGIKLLKPVQHSGLGVHMHHAIEVSRVQRGHRALDTGTVVACRQVVMFTKMENLSLSGLLQRHEVQAPYLMLGESRDPRE